MPRPRTRASKAYLVSDVNICNHCFVCWAACTLELQKGFLMPLLSLLNLAPLLLSLVQPPPSGCLGLCHHFGAALWTSWATCHTRRSLFPCPWELGRRLGTEDGSVVGDIPVPVSFRPQHVGGHSPLWSLGHRHTGRNCLPLGQQYLLSADFVLRPCSGILCGLRQTYL